MKNSKFIQKFVNLIYQMYNPQQTVIKLCTEENVFNIIYNYYKEYYKTHQNLRDKKYLGYTQEGEEVIQKQTDPMDMLIQDQENMRYVGFDFRNIGWSFNKKIKYFICLD